MSWSQEELSAFQQGDGDGYSWQHVWSLQDEALAYRGFRSAPHPATLPPGIASAATNFRSGPGEPFGRRLGVSTAVAAATGLPAGTFKGVSDPYDDGTYVHLALAWKEADNDVHVYHRTYTKSSGVWSNWAQLTEDSGKFNDTALTDPSNGRVQFMWAEVPADSQTLASGNFYAFSDAVVCMISDGTNVRCFDTKVVLDGPEIGSDHSGLGHMRQIPAPQDAGVVFDAYDWLDITGGAVTVAGNASAEWGTVQKTGGRWQAISDATVSGGGVASFIFDTEEITYATYTADEGNWFQPKEILLIAHASADDFWENVTIGFNWKASGGSYAFKDLDTPPLVLPTNTANYELIVLRLPDQLPENAANLLMNGLRFTTTAATPVSCQVDIYAMGVSGVVPAGTEYGICRRSRTTHVFSAGVIAGYTGFGTDKPSQRTVNQGVAEGTSRVDVDCGASPTVHLYATLPNGFLLVAGDSRVHWTPRVKYTDPHTGELTDNAADYVCIYRKEPGDRDFYRVDRVAVASYGGGAWVYETDHSASKTQSYSDTKRAEWRNFSDRLPDESCTPPGAFQAAASVGSRGILLQDYAAGTRVRISEYGSPTRFVDGLAMDEGTKGGFNLKIARERGKAIGQTVSGGRPSEVYLFTDQSVWRLIRGMDGLNMFDLARENALGCCSGQSVAQLDGSLCWHDKNRDFRTLDGPNLSRFKVSEFDAVPDSYIGVIETAYWKGRARTTIVASGGTEPTQVMVYNFSLGEYESKDTFTSTVEPEAWIEWRVDGSNKLYYVGADGAIYEYEKAAQYTDAGQNVAWLVESREFANSESPNWDPINVRHMGVVCTDLTSGTITTTRIFTSPAQSLAGSISVDVSTAYAWKQDTKSGASSVESPGGEGNGVRLRWSASVSAAFEVYAMVAEAKNVDLGGHGS